MQNEVIDKIAALMIAAFGLVTALVWNSTIQEIFRWYLDSRVAYDSSSCNHTDRAGAAKRQQVKSRKILDEAA